MGFKEALTARIKNWSSGGWDGNNLSIFAPEHPLNRAAQWSFSGLSTNREQIENNFEAYIQGAFKANGPVFSCVTARQMVFSEAVFKWRDLKDGKLFGSSELKILETPWPGGTTGNLLSRMEQDVSLCGNSYWTLCNDEGQYGNAAKGGTNVRLAHLRADWITMVIKSKSGDPRAIDARLAGVIYKPLAPDAGNGAAVATLLPIDQVVHYAPIPDPIARFRGMSWITPVLRDIEADKSAVKHKGAFFDNAAVPNMAVSFDKDTSAEDFDEFVEGFNSDHSGSWNAYKTLFLMGGADVTPLSHDFRALDFTNIVGKGEARIASAAGVPPSWVGMSEGMQGSALNTGNMAANRRRFADGTIRPLWRDVVASLAVLLEVPPGAQLWWDETGIAFLREDQADLADIMQTNSTAIDSFIRSGYEPDASVAAVMKNDLGQLTGKHTGLVSVQMQPPVDPTNKNEESLEQAKILETQARALGEFVSAGYTRESAIEAANTNDLSKLKKETDPGAWTPTGQPLRIDPTTGKPATGAPAKPTAPSGKPTTSPGGGGNGS